MTTPVLTTPEPERSTLTAPHDLELRSIDAYLGPRSQRFFGSGYRSVRTALHDVVIETTSTSASLHARGHVEPGGLWSTKGSGDVAPHLSTPDMLRLTEQAAGAMLARRDGARAPAGAWLEEVHIAAGRVPVEHALDRVDVTGALRDDGPGRAVLELQVATMSIRARLRLDPVRPGDARSGQDVAPVSRDVLAHTRLPQLRPIAVEHVRVSRREPQSALAELVIDPVPVSDEPMLGLHGAFAGSLSLVDHFVVGLQLGQVLLYELDELERRDSSTLWMRGTRIVRSQEPRRADLRSAVRTELVRSRLVDLDGSTWRCADIVSVCDDVTLVCSVAHALPGGAR